MAILSNDGLDDQLLLDGNDSFVGGQVSSTRANLVPDDAYVEGKNIDLDEFGNAITRRGASLLVGYLIWEEMTDAGKRSEAGAWPPHCGLCQ